MNQHPDSTEPQTPGLPADLARIALHRAREDARRGRFQPHIRARPRAATGKRRTGSAPVTLGTALNELLTQKTGWLPGTATTLVVEWPSIVGELARGLTPVDFTPETGVLVVRPASRAWLTQTRLLSPLLIQRLNSHMGGEIVRSIRILSPTGEGASTMASSVAAAAPRLAPPRNAHQTRFHPVDPDVQAAVERQARQALREPEGSFTNARFTPPSAAAAIHTRALARACTQRQTST
ncbi:DciA family protein [Streptomyces sp. NEAU-174]|uniref:DciA family protein n=1 Tax=Streptomyces sp. NEAU-174 TaxID=3458254 RepID=UPI0040441C28